MLQTPQWVVWNIFLGAVPVGLGYGLAYGLERWSLRSKGMPWWLWIPLILAWLAFLPNTCYMLTEWRHFLLNPYSPVVAIREIRPDKDPALLHAVFTQSWVFFLYTGCGLLFFALSVRPVERILFRAKLRPLLRAVLLIMLFLLTSLGVYLGLIVRLNSWNIVTHPLYVLEVAFGSLLIPARLKAILIFAVLLGLLYKLVDIWIDGLMLRFKSSGRQTKSK